jgi:hypothetical protein
LKGVRGEGIFLVWMLRIGFQLSKDAYVDNRKLFLSLIIEEGCQPIKIEVSIN